MKSANPQFGSLMLALLLTGQCVQAFQHQSQAELPDIDARPRLATAQKSSAPHGTGVQRLKAQHNDVQITEDSLLSRPSFVSRRNGFLTRTNADFGPRRVAEIFFDEHPDLFGHDAGAFTNAVVARNETGRHNGLRSMVWQQRFEGLPVFGATLQAHVTKRGELVSVESRFVSNPVAVPNQRQSKLTALRAELLAAESLGARNGCVRDLPTKLGWLPMDATMLRLCWDVTLTVKSRGETYRLLLDAQTGEVMIRRCLTEYLAASYRVFTNDSPTPMSPAWPSALTNQPPLVSRALVTLDAIKTNASPDGWLPDWSTETVGNNVDAHTDRNGDNIPDLPRPQCDANRVFDFPLELGLHPTNYSSAAVVQLFYWCNWMHDKLYDLGFTEAAGNFQTDNFGRGGVGGDALQADAQDVGFNNANMTTFSDGSPPRMQMYLWNYATPNRDGDLDAAIILHEYTHGLSWRLVGGGSGIGAMQTQGMGEGWSDFYALALLSKPGDDPNACYAFGAYPAYYAGMANYYFGVRRYPYSTDMAKNPLTFVNIVQTVLDGSVPRSPNFTTPAQTNPSEVHNQGEVWCSALWEVRANLIAKYGFATGNQLALQLVIDGMKLCPVDPNFLQARDAILQADLVNNGGTNRNEIWAGFAKRGMGFSATSPSSVITAGVVEAFDNGDDLHASPDTSLTASGSQGGAFTPTCRTYTLTNAGSNSLSWTAVHSQPWFDVTPASGVLATGATITVSACFNAAANALNAGSYSDTLAFSNNLTGAIQARNVALDVLPTDRLYSFTMDTDPGWTKSGTWAYGKPNGLGGGSAGSPDPTSGATGTNVYGVNLSGNYATTVGAQFNLMSTALNLTGKSNCVLQFQRWLNSDYSAYVQADLYVSTNGTAFTRIWANGLQVTDSAWTKVHYNISSLADNQPTVYLRWAYRILKTGATPMSGWNIDDVEILASAPPTPIPPPRLDIAFTPPDQVTLTWSTNAPGFVLQHNLNVASTNWLDFTNLVTLAATNYQATLPLESGSRFFRLIRP